MLRFGVGGGGTARCACTVRSGCQWELASIARAVKAPHRIVAFEPPVTPGGGHWGNLPPSRFRSFGFTRGHGRHGVWFEIVLRFHFCKHYTTSDQLVLPRFLQVGWRGTLRKIHTIFRAHISGAHARASSSAAARAYLEQKMRAIGLGR